MSHRYANTALAYCNEYGEATTDEAEADSGSECCLSDGYREGLVYNGRKSGRCLTGILS